MGFSVDVTAVVMRVLGGLQVLEKYEITMSVAVKCTLVAYVLF
jgi:hypothetical protein